MPATRPDGAARPDPDVLVIGGGVAGLFCAYYLRQRGASVTVVERGEVGGPQSCSYGNTGFVGTHGATPLAEPGVPAQGLRWLLDPDSPFYIRPRWDGELASWLWHFRRACTERDARAGFGVLLDLKKRSLGMLRELCASGGLAGHLLANGMVIAFKTPSGFEKACRSVPQAVAGGVPLRILAPGELAAIDPDAGFDICGALYNEEGAYLRVPEFVRGFGRMLASRSVAICAQAEVTGFEVAGAAVRQVRTTRGDFRPREVVIAAGAWSGACARKLGIRLKLQPAKGYSITVRTPQGAPRLPVLLSEGKVAIAPFGDRLRLGGTLELSGLDQTISPRRIEGIRQTVRAYLPRMEPAETLEVWSGLRPCTPDGIPFAGRAATYRNVSVCCGHGHIGLGLAPATGELIAQVLAGEPADPVLDPLRPGRYGDRGRFSVTKGG
jgi:D-amino-acid dehydrogenase